MSSGQGDAFSVKHHAIKGVSYPLNDDQTVGIARMNRIEVRTSFAVIAQEICVEWGLRCLKMELVWGKNLISIHLEDMEKVDDVIVALLQHGCRIYLQDGLDKNWEPSQASQYKEFMYGLEGVLSTGEEDSGGDDNDNE